jgi:hypothetical protein
VLTSVTVVDTQECIVRPPVVAKCQTVRDISPFLCHAIRLRYSPCLTSVAYQFGCINGKGSFSL